MVPSHISVSDYEFVVVVVVVDICVPWFSCVRIFANFDIPEWNGYSFVESTAAQS